MNQADVFALLRKEAMLGGVPVRESPTYRMLSDPDLSEQTANDLICSLHRHLGTHGRQATIEAILLVFRIHPLVAVRAIETSSLVADMRALASSFRALLAAMSGDNAFPREAVILNEHLVRYMILLIEASFQNSVCEVFDIRSIILSYVLDEERTLYKSGHKKYARYLSNGKIQEILRHIPENRQIELINWFWRRHIYAFRRYGKTDTFTGRKVAAMMEALPEGALWRHLENADKEELSDRERAMTDRERKEIADFIRSVVEEEQGHHIAYVERVLGTAAFYEKLESLLGPAFREEYDRRKG